MVRVPEVKAPRLQVTATMLGVKGGLAVINGFVIRVGDRIRGGDAEHELTLRSVCRGAVEVERGV